MKMTLFFICFLVSSASFATQDYSTQTEQILANIVKSLNSSWNTESRLQFVTQKLVGTTYGFGSPSGEGIRGVFDRSDLFNLEKLNCTTFVEAALAIARTDFTFAADFVPQVLPQLIDIKYRDGQVRFISRNHFTSVDWVPNVTQKHILEDITVELSNEVREQRATLNIAKWYAAKIKSSKSLIAKQKLTEYQQFYPHAEAVEAHLDYIPLKVMLSKQVRDALKDKKIVVFNMVKEKKGNIPVIVAHQGFILLKGRKLIFRHASTSGKVKDSNYKRYIRARMRDRKWKTLGFNILAL